MAHIMVAQAAEGADKLNDLHLLPTDSLSMRT